jgi:hypothetical protein
MAPHLEGAPMGRQILSTPLEAQRGRLKSGVVGPEDTREADQLEALQGNRRATAGQSSFFRDSNPDHLIQNPEC